MVLLQKVNILIKLKIWTVNMTKLESYVDETFKQAEFYVDIEGDIKDFNVASALQEIKE